MSPLLVFASPSSLSRVPPLPVEVEAGGEGKPDDAGLLAVAVCGGSGRSGSWEGFPRKMAERGLRERAEEVRGRAEADADADMGPQEQKGEDKAKKTASRRRRWMQRSVFVVVESVEGARRRRRRRGR